MKNTFKTLLAMMLLGAMAWGCNPDPETEKVELSAFAQQFLGIKMGTSQNSSEAAGMAINGSFQNMMGARNGRLMGDSTDGSGWNDGDSSIYYDPWVSCAIITTTENSDGSTTSIYDYGADGCEEGYGDYTYFMFGKYIQTYRYSSSENGNIYTDSYQYAMVYDNYGGHYGDGLYAWSIDGNSNYEGSGSYNYVTNEFSGYYSYSDTSLYKYDSTVYDYKSNGKASYNQDGWITEESSYQYGDGTNYYSSLVVSPLVSKYNCSGSNGNGPESASYYVWIPISGREIISYQQDGEEGSFEIDYGNGECDNILYIIEDGVRIEVNLEDFWNGMYGADGAVNPETGNKG